MDILDLIAGGLMTTGVFFLAGFGLVAAAGWIGSDIQADLEKIRVLHRRLKGSNRGVGPDAN